MSHRAKDHVLQKIDFLETQLTHLNHYLPETYDYLLVQLDQQKRLLVELDVQEAFEMIDSICSS